MLAQGADAPRSEILDLQHAHFAGVFKNAAGFDDGGDFAEGLQSPYLAGGQVVELAGSHVDFQFVAGADFVAQTIRRFKRN